MDLNERTRWAIDYVARENGHSDAVIARSIGSRTDTVSRYRSGHAVPKAAFIKRFCSVYGFREDWFEKGEGAPFSEASFDDPEMVWASSREIPEEGMKRKDKPGSDNSGRGRWDFYPEQDDIARIDAEISLQKLSLAAGIKIDRGWIVTLANVIGVPAWKINLSILKRQIDEELLAKIENCGFGRSVWAVEKKPGQPAGNMAQAGDDNTEILKMAQEILHSGSIHATSLAMNIVSLKAALSCIPADDSTDRAPAINKPAASTGCWDNPMLVG
jgi:hypothetical protein